jgi:predicted alpha/beta-fold hydrolase
MTCFDFEPALGMRNAHVQTVLGVLLRGSAFPHRTVRRLIILPDGDRLVLHDTVPAQWRSSQPIALLLHGIGGSHRSGPVVRLARVLYRRGIRIVRLDFRGAGAGIRLARKTYHAGCSSDVRAVIAALHRLEPQSPIWLAAISLGGNVALKLIGEAETPPGLTRVAVVAPPVDLAACLDRISHRANRFYDRYFVGGLLMEARKRARVFPDTPLPPLPKRMTLRLFDEILTAPRAGFRDAADYYVQSSSRQFVPGITIPTLILAARDDPFVDPAPIESLAAPACVEVRMTNHGGHVGYLGAGGFYWGEHAVAEWLVESFCREASSASRALGSEDSASRLNIASE